jgi:hypothetical protein
MVEEGYHAATKLCYLRNYNVDTYDNYPVIECTIPAGSMVYYGADGLIVSNQIIYNRKVFKIIAR